MSNDDFLKSIIPMFGELIEPKFDISIEILFIVLGLIVTGIFVGLGIYAIKDYSSTSMIVGCFVIAALPLIWVGYNVKNIAVAKQTYDIEYENYLVQSETYNNEKKKYYEEQAELYLQRREYTIYLDGVEVEYDKVLFSQYKFSVVDENKTIYLATNNV